MTKKLTTGSVLTAAGVEVEKKLSAADRKKANQFKKGPDPRRYLKGRPRAAIDVIRTIAGELASDIIKMDKKTMRRLQISDERVSRIRRMLLDQIMSSNDKKQRLFLEYFAGKVPTDIDLTSGGKELRHLTDDEQGRAISSLAQLLRDRVSK